MQTDEIVAPPRRPSVKPPTGVPGGRPERTVSACPPLLERRIDLDGHPIKYVDEGKGPLLLFVQAGAGSFLWRDVIVRLHDRFRCVALDVPGTGPSRALEGGLLDLCGLSRILESFVKALDLRDLTLVLHDLGGPVGLGIAPRLHDRIRALIVAESFGWPLAQDSPQLVRMREYDLRVVDGTLRTVLKDRPLLLVFGEHSPAVQAGVPERWRERFPEAGLLLVAGSHHLPMADAPDLVARAIRGWWREEVFAA